MLEAPKETTTKTHVDFNWDAFESCIFSDEENTPLIEELAWSLTGSLTIQELHLGIDKNSNWALVLRRCETLLQDKGSWDCQVVGVAMLPDSIGALLMEWLGETRLSSSQDRLVVRSALSEINSILTSVRKIEDLTFRHEIESDLSELRICLKNKALRAALALAGRVLEMALKLHLTNVGIACDPNSMVGSLLQKMSENAQYTDASLKNQHNIINQYRIAGVHHREKTPIPSLNQVLGVVHVICDTLKRALEARPLAIPQTNDVKPVN